MARLFANLISNGREITVLGTSSHLTNRVHSGNCFGSDIKYEDCKASEKILLVI